MNKTASRRLLQLILGSLMLLSASLRPVAATPPPAAVVDRESVELLEAWVAGRPVPATSTAPQLDPLGDWRGYLRALAIPDAKTREKALRDVYKHTPSPLLRMAVLRTITENPEFQGRQALFIRRYGFYANWFNRLFFSASRLVQGNFQVLAQLVVDGINDLFGSGEANPAERRAYDLLRRSQESGTSRSPAERERFARLERDVLHALAQADLEQAHYTLNAGDPEAAAFYAGQATLLRPDWKKAHALQQKAEREVARLRRNQLASTQVGYPDRNPPVELASPDLLRAILADVPPPTGAVAPADRLIASVMSALPTSHTTGQAAMMRPWQTLLKQDRTPDAYPHRWLETLVYDPQINMDMRLAEARSQRRTNIFKFIFLGPERPRERAYKAATWMTQAWTALQNVGVFYVFEVVARAGQSVWSPPVPAEEVLDAQASWLRQAPEPRGKEARKLAEHLYGVYLKQERFENARRVLEEAGLLDETKNKKINRAFARWLLKTARQMPEGPERQAVIIRIQALDPGSTTAKKAAKIVEEEKKHAEIQQLTLTWETLARWTAAKPPCGLPGEAAWFDGDPANGEAAPRGLTLERRTGEPTLTVRYGVTLGGGRRVHQVSLPFKSLPEPIRRGFEISATQRAEASRTIKQLNRLPIPFALEGGAGPAGVDFYPKLLPMQTRPGEIELYR